MIVVSNTSPLHYFIAVGKAELLRQLFKEVHVPPAVIRELSHASTPPLIRQWITERPTWLKVDALERCIDEELARSLDQGEAEAIQLAEERLAEILIIDEWKGRTMAKQRRIPITGALGILGLAYQQRHLEDPVAVLVAMRKKGFRIHDELAGRFQQLLGTRYVR